MKSKRFERGRAHRWTNARNPGGYLPRYPQSPATFRGRARVQGTLSQQRTIVAGKPHRSDEPRDPQTQVWCPASNAYPPRRPVLQRDVIDRQILDLREFLIQRCKRGEHPRLAGAIIALLFMIPDNTRDSRSHRLLLDRVGPVLMAETKYMGHPAVPKLMIFRPVWLPMTITASLLIVALGLLFGMTSRSFHYMEPVHEPIADIRTLQNVAARLASMLVDPLRVSAPGGTRYDEIEWFPRCAPARVRSLVSCWPLC